ncbi:FCD domain-containing protein [Bradyrhizobium quebecense]|uniref:FadR family transcriptional regulator n=1 Tax=Bradyrhizobium quebecense TaxID=2748629 RepID=A0A974AFE2_9BRAD|nr:FCD domain-containing protein [Bradyrhizobium quebecense]UGA45027.1 FCD domain-containing protein [Bradyrhizobium quebecense]
MDKLALPSLDPSRRASIKRKRSDAVADLIRSHIFQAGLQPNDRLPQEVELIEMFGCSRSTIREALKSLEVQGLVQNTTGPGGGARVAPVSINRIVGLLSNYFYFQSISTAQIYQIRRLIEPELAFSVVGHLTAAHFAALDKAIAVQEHHPGGIADWEHHRHAEIDFHDILIEACPNPLLGLVARFVNEAIRHLIGKLGVQEFASSFTCENIEFHKRLMAAFRSGNAARARRVMLDHVLSAEAVVVPAEDRRMDLPVFHQPLRLD